MPPCESAYVNRSYIGTYETEPNRPPHLSEDHSCNHTYVKHSVTPYGSKCNFICLSSTFTTLSTLSLLNYLVLTTIYTDIEPFLIISLCTPLFPLSEARTVVTRCQSISTINNLHRENKPPYLHRQPAVRFACVLFISTVFRSQ